MKQMIAQGAKLRGVPGSTMFTHMKMMGKLMYLRKPILNLLYKINWNNDARMPTRKKTRPK